MNDIEFNSANSSLKVNQIVSLDYLEHHLYGEVIQLIPERQLCWFRPLCLVLSDSARDNLDLNMHCLETNQQSINDNSGSKKARSIDLQSSSDLLWPDSLFRPALDIEIIDFLPQLTDISHLSLDKKANQKCLNRFVRLVWQAYRDKF